MAFDIEVPEGTTFYRSGMNEEMMHETYAQDVKKYNYMISPSAFTTEVSKVLLELIEKDWLKLAIREMIF